MSDLYYTLLSDGSSDIALMPILNWVLIENGIENAIQGSWADLGRLAQRPRTLAERITRAHELYPCQIMFVHRDAEREPRQKRVKEIQEACNTITQTTNIPPTICVVPIRMTEAWLLFNEAAIRRAAGNRSGRVELKIPSMRDIENLPDPKETLRELLRTASQLHGRRLKSFAVNHSVIRLADLIDDFSPLRELSAFRAFEQEVQQWIKGIT